MPASRHLDPFGLGVCLIVFLCGLALCASPLRAEVPVIRLSPSQIKQSGVVVGEVQSQQETLSANILQGTVRLAMQDARVISTPVAGVVRELRIGHLQEAQANQVLAVIDSRQLLEQQRDYLQVSTQAKLAALKAKRDEQLFDLGIIAEVRLQESRAALTMAQALQQERRQTLQLSGMGHADLDRLEKSERLSPLIQLRAPAHGFMSEVSVSPGQSLEAGAVVARMASATGAGTGALWVEFQLAQSQASQIQVGDWLNIAGCATPARVSSISPLLNSVNQSLLLRAELAAARGCVRPNQFVEAQLKTPPTKGAAMYVPAQALCQRQGENYVFVRTPDGFRPQAVRLAEGTGTTRRVLSGVRLGDPIAVEGIAVLKGAWLGMGAEPAKGSP